MNETQKETAPQFVTTALRNIREVVKDMKVAATEMADGFAELVNMAKQMAGRSLT